MSADIVQSLDIFWGRKVMGHMVETCTQLGSLTKQLSQMYIKTGFGIDKESQHLAYVLKKKNYYSFYKFCQK